MSESIIGIGRVRVVNTQYETAAWYSDLIAEHPYRQYLTGALLEADRANSNGQLFFLDDLKAYSETLVGSPLNLEHAHQQIIGTIHAAEIVYPQATATATARYDKPSFILDEATGGPRGEYSWFALNEDERGSEAWLQRGGDAKFAEVRNQLLTGGSVDCAALDHPYVEILVSWMPVHFPSLNSVVEQASAAGTLSFSMECKPEYIQPVMPDGTRLDLIPYDGFPSPTYPKEVNSREWARALTPPIFLGAALLLPGTTPGWKDAFAIEAANYEVGHPETASKETPVDTMETAELGPLTAQEFKEAISSGLTSAMPGVEYVYVEDFDGTTVYVEMRIDGEGYSYHAFNYAIAEGGSISLSNPRRVMRTIQWSPVPDITVSDAPAEDAEAETEATEMVMPPMAMVPVLAAAAAADDIVTLPQVTEIQRLAKVAEVAKHGVVTLANGNYGQPTDESPAYRLETLAGEDLGWHYPS